MDWIRRVRTLGKDNRNGVPDSEEEQLRMGVAIGAAVKKNCRSSNGSNHHKRATWNLSRITRMIGAAHYHHLLLNGGKESTASEFSIEYSKKYLSRHKHIDKDTHHTHMAAETDFLIIRLRVQLI